MVNKDACIYQHTYESCRFFAGSNGIMQLDFDYEITGDAKSNWFSFWLDPNQNGRWIQETEIDSLEHMANGNLDHNFAGLGHQTKFSDADSSKGHVTTWISNQEAYAMDCASGS